MIMIMLMMMVVMMQVDDDGDDDDGDDESSMSAREPCETKSRLFPVSALLTMMMTTARKQLRAQTFVTGKMGDVAHGTASVIQIRRLWV